MQSRVNRKPNHRSQHRVLPLSRRGDGAQARSQSILSGRSSVQLQPESRSKFVGESVIRLAYTRFFVQALNEDQSFVLCEVREPRPHFASETLGFDRPRLLFFEKHQQPGEVICMRGALLSGKCVLQRTHPAACMRERLQVPDEGIEASITGQDRAFERGVTREFLPELVRDMEVERVRTLAGYLDPL